jgi:Fe-S oxidoreductase
VTEIILANGKLANGISDAASLATLCYQCGVCTAICPLALAGRALPVRKLVRSAQIGVGADTDEVWLCTTCKRCEFACPRSVPIVEVVNALRTLAYSDNKAPRKLLEASLGVYRNGGHWGESITSRRTWIEGLSIKDALDGVEILLYTGCIPLQDPKLRRVVQAVSTILKAAHIDFGVLKTEKCCGDTIYQTGEQIYLEQLVKENIASFSKTKASVVVTISPHCSHMFKTIYPRYGATFRGIHYTELLVELLDSGRLRFERQVRQKVTYHDPCYLSRYDGIQEQPRKLLESIKGVELVEMRNTKDNALCCGGGGGRIFQGTNGERLSNILVREAAETGAQTIATCCPYCIQNLGDSIRIRGNDIEIYDLAELIAKGV